MLKVITVSVVILISIIDLNDASVNRLKRQSGSCQRTEICEDGPYGYVPCNTPGAPQPLKTDNAKAILRQECPHLFSNAGQDPAVCCSDEQLLSLQKVISLASVAITRCPACFDNLRRLLCHMTCSPNQNDFSETVGTTVNENGKTAVTEVNYYVSEKFGQDYYDSCKGVRRFNMTFEQLMCPQGGCDYKRMFQFMGADNGRGGHAPFQFNFIFTGADSVDANGKKFTPMSLPVTNCKDSCDCANCAAAC